MMNLRTRREFDRVCRDVQAMWSNAEIRNSVRLSQNALLHKLHDADLEIVEVAASQKRRWFRR